MFIAYAVVGTLLALALAASATLTLQRNGQIVANMRAVQVPDSWLPRLAALKAAGAVGLLVGLWVTPLGIAAAIGVTLYFVGAVISHLRVRNFELAPAAVLAAVAVAALALRAAA
ncbi:MULTISPECIES: DoxX family protein [unclassified Streptomyces]|uniref:DoxX family protein n=1 Tax=unclassified Streptomyces TaxID=2593676 RepID=UPI002251A47C|nr:MULTISPECIES: DoxX family protein [unclassified Streptomyces]MCX4525771.1 DoxX family protein [Streptomyces sp. NBC_01551]MCX4543665.1 DoxX family protein [Streptomyces sp. NBC_01565]